MTAYVDSSALLKRYIDEPDSDIADALLGADNALVTGRHTIVEVRRNLARMLSGSALTDARAAWAVAAIRADLHPCDEQRALIGRMPLIALRQQRQSACALNRSMR